MSLCVARISPWPLSSSAAHGLEPAASTTEKGVLTRWATKGALARGQIGSFVSHRAYKKLAVRWPTYFRFSANRHFALSLEKPAIASSASRPMYRRAARAEAARRSQALGRRVARNLSPRQWEKKARESELTHRDLESSASVDFMFGLPPT